MKELAKMLINQDGADLPDGACFLIALPRAMKDKINWVQERKREKDKLRLSNLNQEEDEIHFQTFLDQEDEKHGARFDQISDD
jgi:hypothetical protein